MDPRYRLPAVVAGPAGDLSRPGADQSLGEQPRQGPLPAARRARQKVGVGEAAAGGEPALDLDVAAEGLQPPHQARSNRSMSTTKMVAPPTVTSTGMLG